MKHSLFGQFVLLGLCLILPWSTTGCRSCGCGGLFGIDDCADIQEGAVPALAGSKICDWQTAQVSKALLDQTTLYLSDFVDTTSELSPGAANKLNQSVHSGLESQPWIVQPSGDRQLDESRVAKVTELLEWMGVSDPVVMLNIPQAIPLPGPLAESAARNGTGAFNSNSRLGGNASSQGGFRR